MAYQTEAADSWPDNVYQVAATDPVLGGPDGPVNVLGAALATRSRYQRIRNITPWNAALGYPEHSYCQLAGVTYKSLAANTNVQPGTPAAAAVWTRWGHTDAEMSAFAGLPFSAPALCPDAGPAAGANTKAVYKSSIGEYWMWLGDAWKVVANYYGQSALSTAYATTPIGYNTPVISYISPRSGSISASVYIYALTASSAFSSLSAGIGLNGVNLSWDRCIYANSSIYLHCSATLSRIAVSAGDVITFNYAADGSFTPTSNNFDSRIQFTS